MDQWFGLRGWLKQIEFTVIAAIAIAAACVMIGQSAERYADSEASAVADATPQSNGKNTPNFNAIDYATTGSVKGQTVVLSPCAGQPAAP